MADPVGRKENTLFAPLEPEYKFLYSMAMVNIVQRVSEREDRHHVCPAMDRLLATALGVPFEL